MTFAGMPNEKQRADIIAYLNSQSDNPQPLPAAPEGRQPGRGGQSAGAGGAQ